MLFIGLLRMSKVFFKRFEGAYAAKPDLWKWAKLLVKNAIMVRCDGLARMPRGVEYVKRARGCGEACLRP
jgi:hypothetical protein